ncbi:MAG TPA: ATP-binding protein [Burkholderiales bacterium]|nr:ATP-binding protein [Burkholderiales bacterium]
MPASLAELLASQDPLSEEALHRVLHFQEETDRADFKLTFHSEEREWLEITKDVMAFANTFGGYLAFGVRDGTYEMVGLDEEAAKLLCDTNQLMQKVNRYVEPPITTLRSRSIQLGSKTYVVVFTPPPQGQTHLVLKDGAFKFPSGEEKVVLRQGTSYVRRVAGNHLVDSRDLDAIVNRRLDYFRATLLDKIARVVESPPTSEILVVSNVATNESHKKFVIDNAPDALAVKGMSFTVSPSTPEQEIAAWIAMTGGDRNAHPARGITWKWYSERKGLRLTPDQRLRVAMYCARNEVPAFFWLQGCKAPDIKSALREIFATPLDVATAEYLLCVAAFLGKRFHGSLVNELGESMARRLGKSASFPAEGPRSSLRADSVIPKKCRDGQALAQLQQSLEIELNGIAASANTSPGQEPELRQRWRAETIDCHLYSQNDQYT